MPLNERIRTYFWRARTGLYAQIRDRYINLPIWNRRMRTNVAGAIWEVFEDIQNRSGRFTRTDELRWVPKFLPLLRDRNRDTYDSLIDFIGSMAGSIRYNVLRNAMKRAARLRYRRRVFTSQNRYRREE